MSKAGFKRMLRQRSAARQLIDQPADKPAPSLYSPPTDEQLASFVAAMVNAEVDRLGVIALGLSPHMAGLMLKANPEAKTGWIRRHREFQEAVNDHPTRGEPE